MSLLIALDLLAERLLTDHPNIDHGGCCIVAAHVGKCLSKLVDAQIVLGNQKRKTNLNRIRSNINPFKMEEWESNNVDFAHVIVEFKYGGEWYAFDSTHGVQPRADYWKCSRWNRNIGHLTIEEATALANNNGWNSWFNHVREKPKVRRTITNFFKTIVVT